MWCDNFVLFVVFFLLFFLAFSFIQSKSRRGYTKIRAMVGSLDVRDLSEEGRQLYTQVAKMQVHITSYHNTHIPSVQYMKEEKKEKNNSISFQKGHRLVEVSYTQLSREERREEWEKGGKVDQHVRVRLNSLRCVYLQRYV